MVAIEQRVKDYTVIRVLQDIEDWVRDDATLRGGLTVFPIPLLVRLNKVRFEMERA